MDEATMRELAGRLLSELPTVVTDPCEAAEVRKLLARALAQPSGPMATRLMRRALQHESVRSWLWRQRPVAPDELKLPVGDDDGRPARYLTGEVLGEVLVGQKFPLEVAITRQAHDLSSVLQPFAVPSEGVEVRLALRSDGLETISDAVQETFVPPDETNQDSDTVLFELSASGPGVYRPSVRAYVGGKPVGELMMEIVAGLHHGAATQIRSAAMDDLHREPDELALDIVREGDHRYLYRLLAEDGVKLEYHTAISGQLMAVLHSELTYLAMSRTYRGGNARKHLENLGLRLWNDAFPEPIKQSLLEHLDAVRCVSVISDLHTVPWEILYPAMPSGQGGFLAERLAVMRRVAGQEPYRTLNLSPAAYVHPPRSPVVGDELLAVQEILGAQVTHLPWITDLAEVTNLLRRGDFGVLHLACHNESRPNRWDRIQLADAPFTPVDLERAKTYKTLNGSRPLIFFNACRTTGGAVDTRIESWAAGFLVAGSAAFVGSVWPVRATAARRYAEKFYEALVRHKQPLAAASLAAREAIRDDEDPSWLAYAVYGTPSARTTRT